MVSTYQTNMANLTPQLTTDQLKQNIDALIKQNAPRETVQSYIDNYKQSAPGTFTLKNPAQGTEPDATVGQDIVSDAKGRITDAQEAVAKGAVTLADYNKKVETGLPTFGDVAKATGGLLQSGLRAAATPVEIATDTAMTLAEPVVKPVVKAASKFLIPEFIRNGIEKLASTKAGEGAKDAGANIIKNFETWAATHPDAAKNLEGIVNIAGVIGAEKPLQEAGTRLAKNLKTTALETKVAIPEVTSGLKQEVSALNEARKVNKNQDIIAATQDTLSKSERLQAIDEGRLVTDTLGRKKFTPTDTEVRAAEILGNKLKKDPVKNVPIIKDEIAVRGAEAEKYLEANAKPVTNQEDFDMFKTFRDQADRYMTESELKAYDEQLALFRKQLPERGGYNTANYYKALKEYESNVADKLSRGQATLLDPTGIASAKIRAASDIRKIVRDMIGIKNTEFKDRMFDLASLYDAKSTMITKADQKGRNFVKDFIKRNPMTSAAIGAVTTGSLFTAGGRALSASE